MTEQQIIETLATKVMGWEVVESEVTGKLRWFYQPEKQHCLEISDWNPLQNIADAWQVLKRLEATGWEWEMKAANYSHPSIKLTHDLLLKVIYAHGEDEAKTICNAAMKVIA